jgi:hypothetical protein
MFKRILSILAFSVLALSTITTSVAAQDQTPQVPGPMLGIVVSRDPNSALAKKAASEVGLTSIPLTYHGGPVMHTNKTYAIYWVPAGYSVASSYSTIINGFFKNVAAANGLSTNVYYATTQYTDTVHGHILYNSAFGGSTLDTHSFPAGDCTDSYTSRCLGDDQIRAEVNRVVTANHWSRVGTIFFMFTPKGVGSCDGVYCAFRDYCAYHSNFTTSAGDTLYANMPYADTVPAACDAGAGTHPNNNPADPAINLISHEHNETITDMHGNAWYDSLGNEDGDKCAWTFGTALGSTAYGHYNQVIGTGKYYLQREWSNLHTHCVLTGY